MSQLNLETQTIEGVKFYYTKIKSPAFKYQSQTEKEFVVDVQVDKATAKAWNKAFPKSKSKEMDYEDFVEKFGAENAVGDEEQYFIKLKKPANYKDKETGELKEIPDQYRPRVFIDDENGELEDITFTTLVGNGSVGTIQYEVMENSFGTFAKLLALKVDELVVVEQGDSAGKFNVLGKVKKLAENPDAKPKQESDKSSQSQGSSQSQETSVDENEWDF